jgi:hypothetical protein
MERAQRYRRLARTLGCTVSPGALSPRVVEDTQTGGLH